MTRDEYLASLQPCPRWRQGAEHIKVGVQVRYKGREHTSGTVHMLTGPVDSNGSPIQVAFKAYGKAKGPKRKWRYRWCNWKELEVFCDA